MIDKQKDDTTGARLKTPFLSSLGLVCSPCDPGHSKIDLEVAERHHNRWEMAHGGVLMTLLDVSMASAARTADPAGRGLVTIEMKTSFMAPGRGRLTARGVCVSRSASIAFSEAFVVDEDGRTVARSTGTFKYVNKLRTTANGQES